MLCLQISLMLVSVCPGAWAGEFLQGPRANKLQLERGLNSLRREKNELIYRYSSEEICIFYHGKAVLIISLGQFEL